jgi:hypothetical protein
MPTPDRGLAANLHASPGMNPPDPGQRTRDAHLNAARVLMPHADADTQGVAALLLSGQPVTFETLRDFISRARAIHQ